MNLQTLAAQANNHQLLVACGLLALGLLIAWKQGYLDKKPAEPAPATPATTFTPPATPASLAGTAPLVLPNGQDVSGTLLQILAIRQRREDEEAAANVIRIRSKAREKEALEKALANLADPKAGS